MALRSPGPSGDVENLGLRPRFLIHSSGPGDDNACKKMFDPYIGCAYTYKDPGMMVNMYLFTTL